ERAVPRVDVHLELPRRALIARVKLLQTLELRLLVGRVRDAVTLLESRLNERDPGVVAAVPRRQALRDDVGLEARQPSIRADERFDLAASDAHAVAAGDLVPDLHVDELVEGAALRRGRVEGHLLSLGLRLLGDLLRGGVLRQLLRPLVDRRV